MAEALGVAASIVAVIQVADRVVSLCRGYIDAVEGAPRELRSVLIETGAIREVFRNLRYLEVQDRANSSPVLQALKRPIEGCKDCMAKLEKLFPPGCLDTRGRPIRQKLKASLTILAWPLRATRARELLDEMSGYKSTISLGFSSDISSDVKKIKADIGKVVQRLSDEKINEVCSWLATTDPSPNHNSAYDLYEQGTGSWVLRTPEWQAWLESRHRCTWIYGIPGAGKTILASFLWETLRGFCSGLSGGKSCSVFYYCYFARNQDETLPFLEWVLSQLCRQANKVPEQIYEWFKAGRRASRDALLTGLEKVLEEYDTVYIVLDAVDESSARPNLLSLLRDLATCPCFSKLQLLVTSRDYGDIRRTMELVSKPLSLSNDYVQQDIQRYVSRLLKSDDEFQLWPMDLRREIEDALAAGARGMFRWAVCQLDILRRLKFISEIRGALRSLPKTLDETYERIFSLIPEEDAALVRHALRWICFHESLPGARTKTPCSAILQSFIQSRSQNGRASEGHFYSWEVLQKACGCLVSFFDDDEPLAGGIFEVKCAALAHYTVEEFLVSDRIPTDNILFFRLPRPQAVDTDCLTTLLDISSSSEPVPILGEEMSWDNPDVYYTDRSIDALKHFGKSDVLVVNERLRQSALKLLNPSSPHRRRVEERLRVFLPTIVGWDHFQPPPPEEQGIFPVHCVTLLNAISVGCYLLAEWLLDEGHMDGAPPQELTVAISLRSPLYRSKPQSGLSRFYFTGSNMAEFLAVSSLSVAIAEAILEFRKLLEWTFRAGDPTKVLVCYMAAGPTGEDDILHKLLQLGASPSAEDSFVSPLQMKVLQADVGGARALLKAGADVNGTGSARAAEWGDNTFLGYYYKRLHGIPPLRIARFLRDNYLDPEWNPVQMEAMLLEYGAADMEGPMAPLEDLWLDSP